MAATTPSLCALAGEAPLWALRGREAAARRGDTASAAPVRSPLSPLRAASPARRSNCTMRQLLPP
jgi:hypothetical protein